MVMRSVHCVAERGTRGASSVVVMQAIRVYCRMERLLRLAIEQALSLAVPSFGVSLTT